MNKKDDENQSLEYEIKTKYFTIKHPVICKMYRKYLNIKLSRDKHPKEYCLIVSFNKDDDSEITLYANHVEGQPKEKHFLTEKLSYYIEKPSDGSNTLGLPYMYSTHIEDKIIHVCSCTLEDKEDLVVLYRQSNRKQKNKSEDIMVRMIATMHVLLEHYQARAEHEHRGKPNREKLNSRIREINLLYGELDELIKKIARKEFLI